MNQELIQQIEGYNEIAGELAVCRKYGIDYTLEKGKVRELVNRLHPSRMKLRVSDVFQESPSSKTFRLVSGSGLMPPFQAGQYISVFLEIGRVRTSRAYSISSPPNHAGYFDISVKNVEKGFAAPFMLKKIKPGDSIETSGPSGNFYFNPLIHDKTMVMLAGGSGITPFMSMIREITECGIDRTVYLFYGNRSDKDVMFHDELTRISGRFKNVKYIPVLENKSRKIDCACGYIDGKLIKKVLRGLSGKTFYVCGPSAMYDFCVPELEKLGVPAKKIRRELYGPPRQISGSPGWPSGIKENTVFNVNVSGRNTIQARAGEPLLTSLERAGILVPSLCRSGECSMCRVKLLSGKIFQPEGVMIRRSDSKYGYIHSCAAYPLEDLSILI
jgi:ferredoxin-NADP reductase